MYFLILKKCFLNGFTSFTQRFTKLIIFTFDLDALTHELYVLTRKSPNWRKTDPEHFLINIGSEFDCMHAFNYLYAFRPFLIGFHLELGRCFSQLIKYFLLNRCFIF